MLLGDQVGDIAGKLPVPGHPIIVGQRPIVIAVGTGGTV